MKSVWQFFDLVALNNFMKNLWCMVQNFLLA